MREQWTVASALKATKGMVSGKVITVTGGTSGLTECGALDLLINHAGYTVIYK